jgi:hypothetical protein
MGTRPARSRNWTAGVVMETARPPFQSADILVGVRSLTGHPDAPIILRHIPLTHIPPPRCRPRKTRSPVIGHLAGA